MLMLKCYALLNLIKFGPDPGVLFVTIRVKSSQSLQTFGRSVVINEPLQAVLATILGKQ
jgi:hypothetical protein